MYSQGQPNSFPQGFVQPTNFNAAPQNFENPTPKKKLNIFMITTIAEAVFLIILAVMLFMPRKDAGASIADDKTEKVTLSKDGKVDAISVTCTATDKTVTLESGNTYYIENNTNTSKNSTQKNTDDLDSIDDDEDFIEAEQGDMMYLDFDEDDSDEVLVGNSVVEHGAYTVDGNSLHIKPNGSKDYFATYKSHKLTINGQSYDCKNL